MNSRSVSLMSMLLSKEWLKVSCQVKVFLKIISLGKYVDRQIKADMAV
jgi:hypothetical protein